DVVRLVTLALFGDRDQPMRLSISRANPKERNVEQTCIKRGGKDRRMFVAHAPEEFAYLEDVAQQYICCRVRFARYDYTISCSISHRGLDACKYCKRGAVALASSARSLYQ